MAQITINIQTLDWTMGETVGLHLMLKKDCKARIAWGDGRIQVLTGKQEQNSEKLAWVEAGHSYPEKGVNYTITICSEEEDAIIGFDGCGMFEVKTFDVILTECPSLRILGYSGIARRKQKSFVGVYRLQRDKKREVGFLCQSSLGGVAY